MAVNIPFVTEQLVARLKRLKLVSDAQLAEIVALKAQVTELEVLALNSEAATQAQLDAAAAEARLREDELLATIAAADAELAAYKAADTAEDEALVDALNAELEAVGLEAVATEEAPPVEEPVVEEPVVEEPPAEPPVE